MTAAIGQLLQAGSQANQSVTAGSSNSVVQAIKAAASRTGVDFSYLLKKASTESSLNPNAKAATSSATGLFQFTGQTWLRMMKSSGEKYGLGDYASHISVDSTGVAHADKGWKQAILDLRKDPTISAEMAGELDKANLSSLQQNVGGKLGSTDLYLAHFLGSTGASNFINAMRSDPSAKAADIVPDAAASNTSVFYSASGEAKSLKQIYQHFAQKFDGASATSLMASATQAPATATVTGAAQMQVASAASAAAMPTLSSYTASHPQTGNATSAVATSSVIGAVQAGQGSSLFATMILAQMDMDHKAASSLFGQGDDEKRKNVIQGVTGNA